MKDQLDRTVEIRGTPLRIVSLVPSQSELLVDLGLEEALVGITRFCVHPRDLRRSKRIVGGTKKVKFDRIRSLAPDIILCNKEENTSEMVRELEKIAPVHVSDIKTLEEALEMIRQYGEIFSVPGKADGIIREIIARRDDFLNSTGKRKAEKAAYVIWRQPWMVVGRDTFIGNLLELNKFDNVFSKEPQRYCEKEEAAVFDGEAEIILLSSEPFPFREKHRDELREKFPGKRVEIVDGEFFSWYGSRLIKAFPYFRLLKS